MFSQEDELGAIGDYKDWHYQYEVIVTKRNGYKRNMDALPGVMSKSNYLNLRVKVEDETNSTGASQSRLHAVSGIWKMIPADATQVDEKV